LTTGQLVVILSDYYDIATSVERRIWGCWHTLLMNIQEVERLLGEYAARETSLLAPDASIPLYYQLYRLLKRFLETTPINAGDRFPSEEAISASFGVSRPTVNRAVEVLVQQGWLARERGRGTFVQDQTFIGLSLLSENLSLASQFPPDASLETSVISREITTSQPEFATILHLPEDEPLLYIRRLRRVDSQPAMVCDSFLPASRFNDLHASTFIRSSLYATLEEVYGYSIERSERMVVAQEVIDQQVAELLAVPPFSPVLYFTGLTFVEGEDIPIEYMRSYVRECVAFTNTVRKKRSLARTQASQGPKEDEG
jgi:GntR family transcriptional regulator